MSTSARPIEAAAPPHRGRSPGGQPVRWLHPILLPLVSLLVFLVLWQLAAASGAWNETFVPYPSTVWRAFLDVSTTHDGTRGYQGYLLSQHHENTDAQLRRVCNHLIRLQNQRNRGGLGKLLPRRWALFLVYWFPAHLAEGTNGKGVQAVRFERDSHRQSDYQRLQ